ncbi:hypothetical protein C8F04DRAFT_1274528 [Mycena alexandri]|uniref:Ribonuclease H1 N-terminal domain-containing protein n=1 Tax=Mycena alexandri TaxID=1745969 RepID=A0AAD6S581_9AGAR|nr:hypothetical protein C8F04DRAFT_1274528 [Mycena alexandri]
MAPHDLTLAEIAELMSPTNHPERLSGDELDHLIGHLAADDLREVVRHLGLDSLAQQLPASMLNLMLAAQRHALARPPAYEDSIDRLSENLDSTQFFSDSLPHSRSAPLQPVAPSSRPTFTFSIPPRAPPPPVAPSSRPTTFSTSPPPVVTPPRTRPVPVTPNASPSRAQHRSYIVNSPTKRGVVAGWFEAGSLTQGVAGTASVRAINRSKPKKPRAAAWAVFYGGEVDVFTVWADVKQSTTGHGLAIYSGYQSKAAAQATLQYTRSRGWTSDSNDPSIPLPSTDGTPVSQGSISDAWFVVCCGVTPGVYRSHLECSLNTSGVKGSLFLSFDTRAEAEAEFAEVQARGEVKQLPRV